MLTTAAVPHPGQRAGGLRALVFLCVLLPWLNPLAWGPSAAFGPWIFSALLGTFLWAACGPARLHPAVSALLLGLAACILASAGGAPEAVAAAGGCLLVLLSARAAAAMAPGLLTCALAAWVAAALISCVLAGLQYFGLSHVLDPLASAASAGQAFANLRQRNQFASLTAIGMAALVFWPAQPLRRALALPSTALLAAGTAMSASRTGLFELVLLGALAALWRGPQRRERLVLCLAAFLSYALSAVLLPLALAATTGIVAPSVWGRLGGADGCSSRSVLWDNVLDLVAQRPWVGWGWGELDYAHYTTLYPGERFCDILDNAHNLPLHLAVELGVPAMLLVSGLLLWLALRAAPWREVQPSRQAAWAVLGFLGLHSMLEYPLWYGPFQIAFGLCLGVLWGHTSVAHGRAAVRFRLVLAAAVLGVIAYASWDYRRISQIYLQEQTRHPAYREDTLDKIRASWLFREQVRFAEVGITPLIPANAQWMFDNASALLHFSPEPRVVEKVLDSAQQLRREDDVLAHAARFKAAFPSDYARWLASRAGPPAGAP